MAEKIPSFPSTEKLIWAVARHDMLLDTIIAHIREHRWMDVKETLALIEQLYIIDEPKPEPVPVPEPEMEKPED